MTKIVIVGAVAGGATAASQIRRLLPTAEITVFDKGGTMSFGNCGMPYYIGGVIDEKEKLIAATPEEFKTKRNITVNVLHEVIKIDRDKKNVEVVELASNRTFTEPYDKLILSPGASANIPEIDGMASSTIFTLRSFEDMEEIIAYLTNEKPQTCAVVGGGFIGVEMAEVIQGRGISVSLIERNDHIMSVLDQDIASLLDEEMKENNVSLYTQSEIVKMDGSTLTLKDGSTIQADFVIMSVGVRPNTKLAKESGIGIGEVGGILTNEFMLTNDPDIYAIGDVIENIDLITGQPKRVPLAWQAHRQAYIVAKHLEGNPVRHKALLGTSISKVFSKTVAMTGLTEKALKKAAIPYQTVTHKGKTNASYYPYHEDITLKVTYHSESRLILGAQSVGGKGVDKRIDVIATAIYGGLTVDDLQAIEISYAPPYSSPKDPVNMIGYKAK